MMCKLLRTVFAAALSTILLSGTAFAGTWEQEADQWKYRKDEGAYAAGEWIQYHGDWYYIQKDGYMASSTVINGHLIDADGILVSDTVTDESEESTEAPKSEEEHIYVLNPDTMTFHLPSCSGAQSAVRGETVTCKRIDVIAQGYVMCRHCRP